MKAPEISVVIPVYNNEKDLQTCLISLRGQKYPREKIETLICDGGSTDKTVDIARKFGCKIFRNARKLAEFGVALGVSRSKGKFITILAADHEFVDNLFIEKILYPFYHNSRIMMTYPRQDSTTIDSWISKYINTFTDPISHFIYGDAANTRTFYRCYRTIERTDRYIIYDFPTIDYPMVALAQGTTMRRSGKKRENPGDDIIPVVNVIAGNDYLAYVPDAVVAHHTVPSLSIYFRKQRWAFDNYLLGTNYGLRKRTAYFSSARKFKKMIWPFYALFTIPPLIVSIIGSIRDKEVRWLYHFPLTMVSLVALVFEVVRVKILRCTLPVKRKL